MRYGGSILRGVLDFVAQQVKPGVSTAELNQIAEDFIARYPGAKPGFKGFKGYPAALCTSVNEEVVHGIPSSDVILQEGDIVGLDCGVLYQGLYTDAALTVPVGKIDPAVYHFVKTTKKALSQALKVVRPAAHVGDISAVIQKTLEDQGYSPVIECTGHGVGVELHEPPEILNAGRKGQGPLLQAGMTLCIEPISAMGQGAVFTAKDGWTVITKDKSLSAHFENTLLITGEGCSILA